MSGVFNSRKTTTLHCYT